MTILSKFILAACMATTMLAGGAHADSVNVPVPSKVPALVSKVSKVPPFMSHISMIIPPKNKTTSLTSSSKAAASSKSTASLTVSKSMVQTTTAIPVPVPSAPPHDKSSSAIHSRPAVTPKPCDCKITTTVTATPSSPALVSSSAKPINSSSSAVASSHSSASLPSTTPVLSYEDPSNTATSLWSHWSSCHTGTGTGIGKPSTVGNTTYHVPSLTTISKWSSTLTDRITVSHGVPSNIVSRPTTGTTSTPIFNSTTPSKGTATPTSSGEPMFTGAAAKLVEDGKSGLMGGAAVLGFMAVLL
ncbi:hypothetical protein DM02DRAFT_622988 [Periconia macrospinosa]|uniref:Uncharacterized protein n=1 Tax=Periconia macrospinosa TaxID=97972 RepID=A0A2V1EB36_9PLEO|nr:hypothetical protein DM02DRAFT_622988 [Periconia macrospinosa]